MQANSSRLGIAVVVLLSVPLGCRDDSLQPPTVGDAGADSADRAGGAGGAGKGGSGGRGGSGIGGAAGSGAGGGAGNGGAVGGAGGAAGAGGGVDGGGGKDGSLTCGPVCAIFCPNGNVLDDRGCPTCRCKPAPTCQPVTCKIFCQYGFQKDAAGCEICACNPGPTACSPGECAGPAPGAPNIMCADGSLGGPICERTQTGRCAWIFRNCPAGGDCGAAREVVACTLKPGCNWLEPGCTEPRLAVAGCYSEASLGCQQRGCPGGLRCVQRVVNPCGGGQRPAPALPPPGACTACGQTIDICL